MHDIVHQLTIAAPPEEVYAAVATAEGLASWWADDVTGGGDEGDTITVGFDGHKVVMSFRIDALEPSSLAHLTCVEGPEEWPGTQLAFRLAAHDGATVVRFWHGGWTYEDGAMPSCSFQWAMYLDSLRRRCETGTGSPARSAS